MLTHVKSVVEKPPIEQVYLVMGGCWGDEHVIAVYTNKAKAQKRADTENKATRGLGAYVEEWLISN